MSKLQKRVALTQKAKDAGGHTSSSARRSRRNCGNTRTIAPVEVQDAPPADVEEAMTR